MKRQEGKRFEGVHRLPTVRKKRKSKYDVPNYYEGSTKPPFFVSHPGQSKFYDQKEKTGPLTDDPSLNLRPVKDRTVFSDEQQLMLERTYQHDKQPNYEKRQFLAGVVELPEERIRIWFQNRKAKERRDQEDELASFSEKIHAGESTPGYSVKPYKPVSSLHQKLIQLDKVFDRSPKKAKSSTSTTTSTTTKKSHKERDIVKNLIRETNNRSVSTFTTRKTITTKESQQFTSVIKDTVTAQHEQQQAAPNLPSFQAFSRQLEGQSIETDHRRPASSTPTRKRYFRGEEDIDEAKCIQQMLKDNSITTSSADQHFNKKVKVEEEDFHIQTTHSLPSQPAFPQPQQIQHPSNALQTHQTISHQQQYLNSQSAQQPSNTQHTLQAPSQPEPNQPPSIVRLPTPAFPQTQQQSQQPSNIQQSQPAFQHPRYQIQMQQPSLQQPQQPTLQQTLDVINAEVTGTVNSPQWNDPMAYLPRGMEGFKVFFTPDQLNILQLLQQRQVLDRFEQQVKNSTTSYLPPTTTNEDVITTIETSTAPRNLHSMTGDASGANN